MDAPNPESQELLFPLSPNTCFGCGPEHPSGLRVRFFREPDGVRTEVSVSVTHQGPPGVVHGGIQAVILDEACCAAAFFTRDTFVVTGELSLRYRQPCPIDQPLVVRAAVVAEEERYFVVRGELCLAGTDDVLTIGEGKFYPDRSRSIG